MDQRRTDPDRAGEQFIDEAVLAATEAERVEARRGDELRRITAARMRRGEYQRGCLHRRTVHQDRRLVRACDRLRPGFRWDVHPPIQAVRRAGVTYPVAAP
jgi:hypothetical protein